MVAINNLSKKYAKKIVLNNINYRFEENRIYGIVGLNGTGKTTLFNCIVGFTSFDGKVIFSQKNINIGFLPSQLFFYPKTTGLEFIYFCLTARKIKISLKKIEALNKLFNLPLKNKFAENYSDGMKKKLYLLMLLLQKNDVLVLDEPFNNLDISTNIILKELLVSLKNNTTILVSSHILSPLKDICDTIIVLDDTQIKYSLLPAEFGKIDLFFQKKQKICIHEITALIDRS